MKKVTAFLIMLGLLLSFAVPASAGSVTYTGNAGDVIFAPGSEYSLTDLFTNFKDVMPGDQLTQPITVRNRADNEVKVKIYIRSHGAQEDSTDFLSQLDLKVQVSEDNEMGYMFEAAADETAQLTDWVCLGTLYSGGEVNLEAILNVPVTLGNEFQNQIGYLDWEFKIEEFPVDPDDPKPPSQTGDDFQLGMWLTLMGVSLLAIIILIPLARRKKNKDDADTAN